jgi:nitrogen regulatory protein PII
VGIRPENLEAASNPFTVIGELPAATLVGVDGNGQQKAATATMVRNERTALIDDASGRRVGDLRLVQRVVVTFRP